MSAEKKISESLLRMEKITKIYPGVIACNGVDLDVRKGEVHALIGENGAGKSTLIKILAGSEICNSGEIYFDGKKYGSYSPSKAMQLGISVIYQEFNLTRSLTVYENIFFGKEIKKGIFLDKKKMIERTKKVFEELQMDVNPKATVSTLSVAEQQIVEVAKAVVNESKIIVMDEPSATLTIKEMEILFSYIKKLKERGTSVIYISHRLEEIFEIADRVSVLRDGQYITTKNLTDTNKNELIKLMVGRDIVNEYPYSPNKKDDVVLQVRNFSSDKFKDISFDLHKGEILGFAGLVGAGRTEVARAVFGADEYDKGEIFVNNKKVNIKSPRDAISAGIVLLPEDRKAQGLFLEQSIKFNLTFSVLKIMTYLKIMLRIGKEKSFVKDYIKLLAVKAVSQEQKAKNLSGGNQQKLVLAKWLATNSNIIIFDEPTRGIDVGAKQEIYMLMNKLKNDGKSVIMISSELPEVIGMSDRMIIMRNGRIKGRLDRKDMDPEKILSIAVGEEEQI